MGEDRSRRHQAISLQPAHPAAAGAGLGTLTESDAPSVDVDPASDGDGHPDRYGEGWRRYRGPDTDLHMPNVTNLRDHLAAHGTAVVPFEVHTDDGDVTGEARITRLGPLTFDVDPAQIGAGAPEQTDHALEVVRAQIEARRIRPALEDFDRARRRAAGALEESRDASIAAELSPPDHLPDGASWAEDPTAFQAAYRGAQERRRNGEQVVPYMREDATGGLGGRDGGRAFGVEIEFDIEPGRDRREALRAIGRDLHAAGITPQADQTHYHEGRRGYRNWRFERDATVDGEIVSPIMYDTPETWRQLATVCDIVRRHGGRATARTGQHVHVGVGDYDHTVENHNRLLDVFDSYQDVIYRLAQNPERRRHRGTHWCTPNRVPASGYASTTHVQNRNYGHHLGLNFQSVNGRQTDHVEYRMWDSSLDPGVIQAQVNLSLGMTEAAFRTSGQRTGRPERIGTHRSRNQDLRQRPEGRRRLRGDEWREDTRSFRELMDLVFHRQANREQATAQFAQTRWTRR
ncbi:MAG: amidoligase family protein [Acidimicrobiia bacterium]|nr:amidoligase family protein [Acidimicrobiia bacterium]